MKKILIANFGGIKDIMLSAPALQALKKADPDSVLHMLIFPEPLEYAMMLSCIDNITVLQRELVCLSSNLKLLFELRKEKFDIMINMRTLFTKKEASYIQWIINAVNPQLKVGRNTDGRGKFFDIKIPETSVGEKYEMEYNSDIVKALGVEEVGRDIDFPIDEKSQEYADDLLKREGIEENMFLMGIHPGGGVLRRWSIDKLCEVIRELNKKFSFRYVITGSNDEKDLGEYIVKEIEEGRVIDLTGKLGMPSLGAVIKRCNLFVSNDAAPLHIAAVFKTPLIALFGSTDLTRYDPRNICDKAEIIYNKQDCAPCKKSKCEAIKCMDSITIESVVQACLKFINPVQL
ncbi:MAG: glycosyltransferase family 9 protein [Candidatus Omnitrophota bacterium]